MPTPRKANPQKGGRPSTYREEFVQQAEQLIALGATDMELAAFFRVTPRTIENWKLRHPEFFQTLKVAKDEADARVERRLWERAMGYSVATEKLFCSHGKVIRAEIVEHYPPDTTACIFWLKNRQPERWRDRVDVQHQDGRIGVIGRMPTDEEWAERYGGGGEPVLVVDNSP